MVNPPTNPTARENPNQSALTTQFISLSKERELKMLQKKFEAPKTQTNRMNEDGDP